MIALQTLRIRQNQNLRHPYLISARARTSHALARRVRRTRAGPTRRITEVTPRTRTIQRAHAAPARAAHGPRANANSRRRPTRRRDRRATTKRASIGYPSGEDVDVSIDIDAEMSKIAFERALPTMFSDLTMTDPQHWRSTHARIANGPVVPQQLIGGTPMIDLSEFSANPKVKIYGKCEYLNPSGSIKDRIAQEILARALETGELKAGMTVVAATSGNTGAAIAMACAIRGFPYIVITNQKTSKEKIDAMRAYGGEVIVAPSGVPADHPDHYQNIEATMCAKNPKFYGVNQYDNPYNADAYEKTLGPEIWSQTEGAVTHFVAGGSTGGTITGTGRYLKSVDPTIKIVLADPKGSVLWDYFVNDIPEEELVAKSWEVEGVGKDSIPGVLDTEYIDGAVMGDDSSSFRMVRTVAESSGVLLGGSSGLNLHAARVLSSHIKEGTIVTVLCDSGVKYLSKIYNDEWLQAKNLDKPLADVSKYEVHWKNGSHEVTEDEENDSLWGREQEEKELRFLDEVATHMVEYHRNSIRATEPVSVYNSPADLHASFEEMGVPLNFRSGESPISINNLTTAMNAVLDNSVRSSHPMFMNQLYAGVDPIALAGEWASSALNSNVHTFEVAPILTEIERSMLAKIASLWLGENADGSAPDHDGLFVPGGSIANLYSMILARERACPEAKKTGMPQGYVAFCSEQSHYSYKKCAHMIGLGMDNMIKVDCGKNGAMLPEALEAAIAAAKAAGKTPFYCGATAGSTVLGAYDPFAALADVCAKDNVWLHVDGAWGGAALVSKQHKHLMNGVERADSFCWNPHKLLGIPLQCSIVLSRHAGEFMAANSYKADYLFQPDKNNTEADLGDRTIQCGRKSDALKLWLAWKYRGDEGWEKLVDHAFSLAKFVEAEVVQDTTGAWALATPAQCANVGFWYVPPRLRPFNKDTATPEQFAEIAKVAPKLKDRMQRAGDAMIGFQPVPALNLPNFFRLVLPNPRHNSETKLRELMKRMDAMGADL